VHHQCGLLIRQVFHMVALHRRGTSPSPARARAGAAAGAIVAQGPVGLGSPGGDRTCLMMSQACSMQRWLRCLAGAVL